MRKAKEFNADELRLFYLWLSGQIKGSKQTDENLIIVYLCCPAERDSLVKEFLTEFRNERRYLALRRYLNVR